MPFSSFGLHPDLIRGVKDLAFTRPTPIQAEAIPPAMLGRDLIACASTGSGKTAAFLLPTMHHLISKKRGITRVLILTPTRELAAQIQANFTELATHTALSGAAIYGGVSMSPQTHAFRTGVDILVATPGRLLDHLRSPYAKLNNLEILILDEADRMLDMGFLPDIRRILKTLPEKRQTLFFSATMPPPIFQLTREMLKNPVQIQIERQAAPAVGITQAIYPVPQHLKASLLLELLKSNDLESVIAFTRTKHRANRVADYLSRHGIACERIHGNRSQGQRTAALAAFKAGECRVLVATDIAARGIDITAVSHVINFDVPHVPEDYIHRVGRTGRASLTGDAFTFVAPDEESDLRQIERAIAKRLPRVTLPEFDYNKRSEEKLEVPIAERIAAIRARKAQERSNSAAKAQRSGPHAAQHPPAGGNRRHNSHAPQNAPQPAKPHYPPTANRYGKPNLPGKARPRSGPNPNFNRRPAGPNPGNSGQTPGPHQSHRPR